ncbi:MAG TPA: cupredoxin domain-containing protein [Terracidiphilus sp.]
MEKITGLFVLSCALTASLGSVQKTWAAAESPRHVEVTAHRYTFDPGVIVLRKGQPVVLVLKSADVAHGLRIRELGIEIKVPRGGSTQIQFTPDKVGDFVGHCSVFCGSGHGTMTLTLRVVD